MAMQPLDSSVTSPVRPRKHPGGASVETSPEPVTIPDLLHHTPMARVDVAATKLAVALAFASGTSGGLFNDALERASVARSSFDPAAFVNDLFVQSFVRTCLRARVDGSEPVLSTGHLLNVLTHPPSDVESLLHRRAIVTELQSSPELRGELERLYTILCRLRGLLEGATGVGKWDANRRQIEILALVKEAIDCMSGFASATSGLHRLGGFARRVQASEPYRSLSDFLRYEEHLATLNLKVRVGADGRIRGFEIVSAEEDRDNAFASPWWRRWLTKIELFVRGYRFDDGEVLSRLIYAVFDGLHDEIVRFVQLLGDLEVYLGVLGFSDRARDAGLPVCLPELVDADEPRALEGLYNPLLLASGVKVVPCDLRSDRHDTTVLITGPNSGGKTRLLQSLGLSQLLAQGGLLVPARAARLSLASGLVVSLIQETKADQAEGRLGMELLRIRELFERLPPGAMVLLDELCSGTNPSEGEEIFELVIDMLAKLGPQAFITTHFLAFSARLERERKIAGLRFIQVALGADQQPTYQFVPGVALTSLAGHAAARLGVTAEQLSSLIQRNLSSSAPAGRRH